jgi:hypothetical protein
LLYFFEGISTWVFLTLPGGDRFLAWYLLQGVVLLALGVYSWSVNPQVTSNHHNDVTETEEVNDEHLPR